MFPRGRTSILIAAALLAGCATPGPSPHARDATPGLAAGMTMDDVRHRLGEPRRVVTTTAGERWTYADGTAFERPEHAVVTTVTFDGERLAGIEAHSGD